MDFCDVGTMRFTQHAHHTQRSTFFCVAAQTIITTARGEVLSVQKYRAPSPLNPLNESWSNQCYPVKQLRLKRKQYCGEV